MSGITVTREFLTPQAFPGDQVIVRYFVKWSNTTGSTVVFGLNTLSDSPQQLSSPIVWGFNQWSLSDPTLGVSGDTVSFNTLGTALESVPDVFFYRWTSRWFL